MPRSAALLALLLASSVVGRAHAAPIDLHVSPSGNDTADGTSEQPFRSLEAARDRVRRLRRDMRAGALAEATITVRLHAGDHLRRLTLELGAEDSGSAGAPVVWTAADGSVARLLGGERLRGFAAVAEEDALRARLPAAARTQVRVASAETLSDPDDANLTSRGFGRAVTPSHPELFHGGRPMPLARWPNEGSFETIRGFPTGSTKGDDHGGRLGDLPAGFTLGTARPAGWAAITNVWVHGYWAWDWANSYERITAFDPASRLVTTAPPHGLYGFRQGQRIYFVNVPEELDSPGEWYFDRATRRVFIWPPDSANAETLLSTLTSPLVRLREAAHIEFRGLILEATRATAVEIHGGDSVRLVSCLIRNVGNHGVLVQGGSRHAVVACDILDTGDGGVSMSGGDRATLRPSGHEIINCHFQRQGRWSKCYVPAIQFHGVGHRAANNLIHDHPHCAILYWGNDHLIERNEIHHVALETGDVGAIYSGRDYTFRGNRILHNFIHDTGGVGMGSMGAYMDDCVSGTEIYGNIFHRVHRAVFLGGGRDHRVANNVFVDCEPAVELDGRGLDRSPVWRGMVDETMRARLAEVPLALYRERYPDMQSLDAAYGPPGGPVLAGTNFIGVAPANNRVERNVCVGSWQRTGWHATTNDLLDAQNLVGPNPGFAAPLPAAPRATDFALKSSSPAWALGFAELPLREIGLVDDAARRAVERLHAP